MHYFYNALFITILSVLFAIFQSLVPYLVGISILYNYLCKFVLKDWNYG